MSPYMNSSAPYACGAADATETMRVNRPPILPWIALAIFVAAVLMLSRLMLSL